MLASIAALLAFLLATETDEEEFVSVAVAPAPAAEAAEGVERLAAPP